MMSGAGLPPSYYEDLQARLRALLVVTGAWISSEQLSLFNELVDANECGVALDMLSEVLASSNARIDNTVLQDVRSLSDQMGLGPVIVDRLRPLLR
jgi:hypothetical protein